MEICNCIFLARKFQVLWFETNEDRFARNVVKWEDIWVTFKNLKTRVELFFIFHVFVGSFTLIIVPHFLSFSLKTTLCVSLKNGRAPKLECSTSFIGVGNQVWNHSCKRPLVRWWIMSGLLIFLGDWIHSLKNEFIVKKWEMMHFLAKFSQSSIPSGGNRWLMRSQHLGNKREEDLAVQQQ